MFKKRNYKGPWSDNVERIMEQSAGILAASFINSKSVFKDDVLLNVIIKEIRAHYLDIAQRVWENAEAVTEARNRNHMHGCYSPFYSSTVKTTIPVNEIEKIVKDVIEREWTGEPHSWRGFGEIEEEEEDEDPSIHC